MLSKLFTKFKGKRMSNTENEKELSEATEEVAMDDVTTDTDLSGLDLESQVERLLQDKALLAQRLIALDEEKNDKVKRAEAEMINLRRRTEIDLSNAHKFALDKFVKELLPCIDAVEAEIKELEKKADLTEEFEQFKRGSELTYRMLLNAVEKFGVKQIAPEGEMLNPELHQAIAVVPMPDKESNTIIDVTQKGYTLNDRLVRPALVVVAQ